MPDDIKYIDIAEFCALGYLQEVNRQFLHPRGLALEVTKEADGTEHLSGVWDYRDDPEGVIFNQGAIDHKKISEVEREFWKHEGPRRAMFINGTIQPSGWVPPDD